VLNVILLVWCLCSQICTASNDQASAYYGDLYNANKYEDTYDAETHVINAKRQFFKSVQSAEVKLRELQLWNYFLYSKSDRYLQYTVLSGEIKEDIETFARALLSQSLIEKLQEQNNKSYRSYSAQEKIKPSDGYKYGMDFLNLAKNIATKEISEEERDLFSKENV